MTKQFEEFLKQIDAVTKIEYVEFETLPHLRNMLNDGFRKGLYVLGAMPSTGKTTLVGQIADSIAEKRKHVLYFSREMCPADMYSKSLSRLISLELKENFSNLAVKEFKTRPRKIEEITAYQNAVADYQDISNYIYYPAITKDIKFNADFIINEYQKCKEKKPIIIIDYLQSLESLGAVEESDKQRIDNNLKKIMFLKQETTVICISSLNRTSYRTNQTNYDSFKESGSIEYDADMLLTLTYDTEHPENKNNDTYEFDEMKARENDIRHLNLYVLKNRYGKAGNSLPLEFNACANIFEEGDKDERTFLNKQEYRKKRRKKE